ncbi:MAG: hypothetical protein CSA18_04710 [Deltaproteobacteria bacterium]|nr:MAG: hypothetical protein CSA18_04710 [Deltaproteobacteria bacterium]
MVKDNIPLHRIALFCFHNILILFLIFVLFCLNYDYPVLGKKNLFILILVNLTSYWSLFFHYQYFLKKHSVVNFTIWCFFCFSLIISGAIYLLVILAFSAGGFPSGSFKVFHNVYISSHILYFNSWQLFFVYMVFLLKESDSQLIPKKTNTTLIVLTLAIFSLFLYIKFSAIIVDTPKFPYYIHKNAIFVLAELILPCYLFSVLKSIYSHPQQPFFAFFSFLFFIGLIVGCWEIIERIRYDYVIFGPALLMFAIIFSGIVYKSVWHIVSNCIN